MASKSVSTQATCLVFLTLSCFCLTSCQAAAFISGSIIKCFNEGEDVKVSFLYDDPCIKCKCVNQEIVCERECSHLKRCTHNGRHYKSGETWKNGTCNLCTCNGGEISCQVETCAAKIVCSKNERVAQAAGDCCPSCIENDGECSLTSPISSPSESSLRTFDGHTYDFNGLCNYVFARDSSEEKKFSVHIVHELNSSSEASNAIINSLRHQNSLAVVVKVDGVKIRMTRVQNGLEMWKLRVGRREASLPFIKLGIVSVIHDRESIQVRSSNLGLKIVWNKNGNLYMSIPSRLKNNVTGLCGNYNGDTSDDIRTKKGRIVHSMDRFIHSWKVGKKGICAFNHVSGSDLRSFASSSSRVGGPEKRRKIDNCASDWEKKVKAINVCNILKSPSFGACHRVVSILPFFKSCTEDVCSSPKDREEGRHCSALDSYAMQCQAKGIKLLPDWKTLSLCDSQTIKKVVPTCPQGAIYTPCANPCPRTCNNLKPRKEECNKQCKPGCECPIGTVLHKNRCISPRTCRVTNSVSTASSLSS